MCIAILKKKDGNITDEQLKNCFEANPDGAGIAYNVNKKLIIEKGIFHVEDFIKKVRKAEKRCDGNMLIHCRISTSGNIDKDNCHPFFVNSSLALIHNGILDIDVPKNSPKNDTRLYIERYLQGFTTYDLIHNQALKDLIGFSIGSNKFVLLSSNDEFAIINEDLGHWKNNVWFSNNSYESRRILYDWYDRYEDEDNFFTLDVMQDFFNSQDVIEETSEFLYCLSEDELIEFGDNPLIDYQYNLELYNPEWIDAKDRKGIYPLKDVSQPLYQLYKELYKEAIQNILRENMLETA